MNSADDEREGMGRRISDWEHAPPQPYREELWDWRTIGPEDLDPVTARMVETYRQRAAELGFALTEAPDDPFIMFAPPYPPYPDD